MKSKTLWITETGVLLALLVTLQAVTKPLGQIVTGSCVNTVLAVAVLVGGLYSGLTVAVLSPVLAWLLGIAQLVVTPAIMVGNSVFVLMLHFLADPTGKNPVRQAATWLLAAVAKFATLYFLVVKLICGPLSSWLMGMTFQGKPVLVEKMLTQFPVMFSWLQLATALIGGAIALVIAPVIRKALHK